MSHCCISFFSSIIQKSYNWLLPTNNIALIAYKLEQISKDQNGAEIIRIFKDIILKSYGIRSEDKKRFIKSESISKEFEETEAYSELFYELALDADKASAFVNGIMPKDIVDEVKKNSENNELAERIISEIK